MAPIILFHGLPPQGNHFVMLIHNSRHLFQQQSHQEQSADWVAKGILKSLPVLWEDNRTCTLVQPVLLFTWGCSHGTQCHIQGAKFASFHWCTSKSGRHIWLFVLCSDCHIEPPGHTDWYLNTLTVCLWGPMMKRHGLWGFLLLLLFKSPLWPDLPSTAWKHVWCKGQFKGRAFWDPYTVVLPGSELALPLYLQLHGSFYNDVFQSCKGAKLGCIMHQGNKGLSFPPSAPCMDNNTAS